MTPVFINKGDTPKQPISLTKVHAILMFLAWGLFAPIGYVFSLLALRLRVAVTFELPMTLTNLSITASAMIKTVFDGHSIGKQWFQVHRAILMLVPVLTLVGFILILVDKKGVFSGSNHAIIGTTVFVLAMIQPIMGMLRPGFDSKWRIWFGAGMDYNPTLSFKPFTFS